MEFIGHGLHLSSFTFVDGGSSNSSSFSQFSQEFELSYSFQVLRKLSDFQFVIFSTNDSLLSPNLPFAITDDQGVFEVHTIQTTERLNENEVSITTNTILPAVNLNQANLILQKLTTITHNLNTTNDLIYQITQLPNKNEVFVRVQELNSNEFLIKPDSFIEGRFLINIINQKQK